MILRASTKMNIEEVHVCKYSVGVYCAVWGRARLDGQVEVKSMEVCEMKHKNVMFVG